MTEQRHEDFNYEFVLRGYDVIILPSDKGDEYFFVSVSEMGRPVFEDDILMSFEFDDELHHEDPYTYAANAAIDFYEADKGTLGLGSGAEPPKKKSKKKAKKMHKRAFYPVSGYEDWLMGFKGTPFEEEAFQLILELIEHEYQLGHQENKMLDMLYDQREKIVYDMNKLDLERLRKAPKTDITVIIKNSKISKRAFGADSVSEFLEKFEDCELESQAVMLAKDYISTIKQIKEWQSKQEDSWKFTDEIYQRIDELTFKKLEWETMGSTDIRVEMDDFTGDMIDLMDQVELGEIDDTLYQPNSYMTAYKMEDRDLEDRSEYDLDEMPEKEETEELLPDRAKFDYQDSVKLTKDFEKATWYGEFGDTVPKGSKGVIQSDWEGTDEFYVVFFEDFGNIKVPAKFLSKA